MQFFEDVALGERTTLGRHTFLAEDIKRFAARWDPQSFHLDEAAAARSSFGGLCASGWHTAAVWMRLFVERRKAVAAAQRARGEAVAVWGASPGFRDLHWLKPVYAGDTIEFASEPIDKQPSDSRPGWGLVWARNTGTNEAGELVFAFVSCVHVERRGV